MGCQWSNEVYLIVKGEMLLFMNVFNLIFVFEINNHVAAKWISIT